MRRKEMGSMDFKRVTLSITGTMASTREYELLKTTRGMSAAVYDGPWVYHKLTTRSMCREAYAEWGAEDYAEFAERLFEIGVPGWAGYSGSNPNVLDGESFSLDVELADGKMFHAHGQNAYPNGYWDFYKLLNEAVEGPKGSGK